MQTSRDIFSTVHSEGSLLPPSLLRRIAEGDTGVGGLAPSDYHLVGEKINEAVNRAWNRALVAWQSFREASVRLPESDVGTTVTRERWLLVLFNELGYGRLQTAKAVEVDGRSYPVSHLWNRTPIHLVGFRVDLDRRTAGVVGASRVSPHGLVQDLLNRSNEHLWGILSNGRKLRLLRDSASLVRQAYVEFDLESMMEGLVFSDFVLLWLLCHQSRVEAQQSAECWLERWTQVADEQGTRALDHLRDGVEAAIQALGQGFLQHKANRQLLQRLRSGELSTQDYYRQLLRMVYRLIFLFVAEDRDFLFAPGTPEEAKARYREHYSTARVRALADRRRGSRHVDLWRGLRLVFGMLKDDTGCPALGLPALNSFLWSLDATADLISSDIQNADLLEAVRSLAFTVENGARRAVDFRNLGPEELGSVYESLLELHPEVNADAATFGLSTASGNERKTTGSYYTPDSLIQQLLDTALDPVVARAMKEPDPGSAILGLKVIDTACGSGHFLIAAAHRMAKRLASVRTGEDEPSPSAVRRALRDVIGRCIYGVDINPMAVELCKVSLWMDALEPGKPLSFLDHHVQVGNALVGTTPALIANGLPDEALVEFEGDEKKALTAARKQNKKEREKQTLSLFGAGLAPWEDARELAGQIASLAEVDDSVIAGIHEKQRRYDDALRSDAYARAKLVADAWCAAFVWRRTEKGVSPVLTEALYRAQRDVRALSVAQRDEVRRLAEEYQFFHWHLAFPEVFTVAKTDDEMDKTTAGWSGGFDVVLGNPPWERLKLQEQEWFAARRPDIADAPTTAERRRLIDKLRREDEVLYGLFAADRRKAEGASHFVRNSGRYPLCGRGDVNTFSVFAETNLTLLAQRGRAGCIVPSGIASDDTTKFFFQELMTSGSLASLYSFENEAKLFPAVDHRVRFSLLTMGGTADRTPAADFVFFARRCEDLHDEWRHFSLSGDDLKLLNPNTGTCPTFRSRSDAEFAKSVYRRVPVLQDETSGANPWRVRFTTLYHMSADSEQFKTREHLEREGSNLVGNIFTAGSREFWPLYEGKMFWHFDHRFGTHDGQTQAQANQGKLPELTDEQHADPTLLPLPRYWVSAEHVRATLAARGLDLPYFIAFRNITSSVVQRTGVFALLPATALGHSASVVAFDGVSAAQQACFLACMNSLVVDYFLRQSIGGSNLSFFILRQLPILPPAAFESPCPWAPEETVGQWISRRVLELCYTATDLVPFAEDIGWTGSPFRWSAARRTELRSELDAAMFLLYGVDVPRAAAVMESFGVLKRLEEDIYGSFVTSERVLAAMRRLAGGEAVSHPVVAMAG